jgi:hypothetical protein
MADIYFDVDAALTEVPVNAMPLVDSTDFLTLEDAVSASSVTLTWHFVTSAGVYNNGVSFTPTASGGAHDWVDHGTHAVYTVEMPASAGTINNDTEGYGWFTGVATGVAPWRSPVYGFRAAAINDALCDGGDLLDVNVTQNAGTAITAAAGVQAVNTTQVNGTAQTARDLGASVLLSSGTGTGQVSLSSGLVRLSSTGVDDILDEVVEGTWTFRGMLRLFASVLVGKASGLGTTTAVYRDIDDTKNRVSATVDADGNRTAFGTRDQT